MLESLSRRSFLKSAAALAAAPLVVPSSALGRGAVAPSERIVMGGIGIGGRGTADLTSILGYSDVQWAAVCDVRGERRRAGKAVVDQRYGRVYQAGTQRRSEEPFLFAALLGRTGLLGKLHTITDWGAHTIDTCALASDTENTAPVEYEYPHNETGNGLVARYACSTICVQLQRNLTWDPVKEEFPGDPEANRLRSRALRAPWSL